MNAQDTWMEMVYMGPEISDAEIQYHLAPIMNPSIDWIQKLLTHEVKLNGSKSHLEMLTVDLILPEREIPEITYDMLATEQKQAYDLTKILLLRDESDVIMILGPTGSGKSTTIYSIKKMVDDILYGSVLALEQVERLHLPLLVTHTIQFYVLP